MVTDNNFVVSVSCRDSLAQSGNYSVCSDVDLSTGRLLCELWTNNDTKALASYAKQSDEFLVSWLVFTTHYIFVAFAI